MKNYYPKVEKKCDSAMLWSENFGLKSDDSDDSDFRSSPVKTRRHKKPTKPPQTRPARKSQGPTLKNTISNRTVASSTLQVQISEPPTHSSEGIVSHGTAKFGDSLSSEAPPLIPEKGTTVTDPESEVLPPWYSDVATCCHGRRAESSTGQIAGGTASRQPDYTSRRSSSLLFKRRSSSLYTREQFGHELFYALRRAGQDTAYYIHIHPEDGPEVQSHLSRLSQNTVAFSYDVGDVDDFDIWPVVDGAEKDSSVDTRATMYTPSGQQDMSHIDAQELRDTLCCGMRPLHPMIVQMRHTGETTRVPAAVLRLDLTLRLSAGRSLQQKTLERREHGDLQIYTPDVVREFRTGSGGACMWFRVLRGAVTICWPACSFHEMGMVRALRGKFSIDYPGAIVGRTFFPGQTFICAPGTSIALHAPLGALPGHLYSESSACACSTFYTAETLPTTLQCVCNVLTRVFTDSLAAPRIMIISAYTRSINDRTVFTQAVYTRIQLELENLLWLVGGIRGNDLGVDSPSRDDMPGIWRKRLRDVFGWSEKSRPHVWWDAVDDLMFAAYEAVSGGLVSDAEESSP